MIKQRFTISELCPWHPDADFLNTGARKESKQLIKLGQSGKPIGQSLRGSKQRGNFVVFKIDRTGEFAWLVKTPSGDVFSIVKKEVDFDERNAERDDHCCFIYFSPKNSLILESI